MFRLLLEWGLGSYIVISKQWFQGLIPSWLKNKSKLWIRLFAVFFLHLQILTINPTMTVYCSLGYSWNLGIFMKQDFSKQRISMEKDCNIFQPHLKTCNYQSGTKFYQIWCYIFRNHFCIFLHNSRDKKSHTGEWLDLSDISHHQKWTW